MSRIGVFIHVSTLSAGLCFNVGPSAPISTLGRGIIVMALDSAIIEVVQLKYCIDPQPLRIAGKPQSMHVQILYNSEKQTRYRKIDHRKQREKHNKSLDSPDV